MCPKPYAFSVLLSACPKKKQQAGYLRGRAGSWEHNLHKTDRLFPALEAAWSRLTGHPWRAFHTGIKMGHWFTLSSPKQSRDLLQLPEVILLQCHPCCHPSVTLTECSVFAGHFLGPRDTAVPQQSAAPACMGLVVWQEARPGSSDPASQPYPLAQGHRLLLSEARQMESRGQVGSMTEWRALILQKGDSWPQLQPIAAMWGCGPSNCQHFRYFKSSCKSRLLHKIFQFFKC